MASDPGPSYGCLVSNDAVYTKWIKTDFAPGNPSWGPWEYYDTTGINYTVDYNQGSSPPCGYINPNSQFSQNGTCFVQKAPGLIVQGLFGEMHDLNSCNVPLDDSIYLLFGASLLAVFFIRSTSLAHQKL